jgi:hypothetical protein
LTQIEQYLENLQKFGILEKDKDPLAWNVAKKIRPEWFTEPFTKITEEGAFPMHLLDNYAGQHLYHRREAYNTALEILEMLKPELTNCSCGGSCGCK